MEYTSKNKKFHGTNGVKLIRNESPDIKSFNIVGDKYEDKRRVITRRFI